jgi:hypothetical protein
MKLTAWIMAGLVLPLSAQTFAWQREIRPAGAGPQRLEVDLALLGASRAGLADLRLKTAGGTEVPYVLVPPAREEAPWVKARLLPLPATKVSSGLELDLGQALPTGRLRLEGLRAPFLKRFRLEGSGDRQRWTELVGGGSLFDLPAEGLRLLTVDFPQGEYRYLRLVWNDRTSAPIPMPRAASVQRPEQAPAAPSAALAFERRPAEPGVSRFNVRLPGPGLPLRALVLEVGGDGPLLRQARVVEPRLVAGALVPRPLGEKRLQRTRAGDATAADLKITLEPPQGIELDLRVEDGSNPGLPLTGVRAELEPQPWIYFEAANGEPLTAFCGDPRLAPPRYDLEARRDTLTTAGTAAAQRGSGQPGPGGAAVTPIGLDGGPGAPLEAASFRFRRSLPAGAPGLTALVLDPHVLTHSIRLQDLRLIDAGGRQVPYLLERRDEPLTLPLTLSKGLTKGHSTLYTLALPQAGLAGAQLALETPARLFRRQVLVREETSGGESRALAATPWAHGDPGALAPALLVALPPLATAQLTVEVEEGDNPALPVSSAKLLLPTWRLRFFQPQGPLTLCYGQDLDAPRYDLALLAERLRDAPVREAVLDPEGGPPAAAPAGPGMKRVFWGVLVAAVVAMLAILGRLLKASDEGEKGA